MQHSSHRCIRVRSHRNWNFYRIRNNVNLKSMPIESPLQQISAYSVILFLHTISNYNAAYQRLVWPFLIDRRSDVSIGACHSWLHWDLWTHLIFYSVTWNSSYTNPIPYRAQRCYILLCELQRDPSRDPHRRYHLHQSRNCIQCRSILNRRIIDTTINEGLVANPCKPYHSRFWSIEVRCFQ